MRFNRLKINTWVATTTVFLIFASNATAQLTLSWVDANGGLWQSTDNWSTGFVPTDQDIALFDMDETYPVFWGLGTGDREIDGIRVDAGDVRFVNIDNNQPELVVGSNNLNDSVLVRQGSTLRLEGIRLTTTGVVDAGFDGQLIVDGNHLAGTNLDAEYLQVFSDGKLTVCDGAVVDVIFDTYIETGFLSTDNNQIKGTGTQFNSDRLFVSNAVEAELDITGGAVVNVEDLTSIGDLSAGKLLVSSPATTLNSGRLDVGFQGTGDLDIQLGAKVFAKQIASIGTLAGATGAVSIQGQDSELVVLEEAGFSTLAIGELGTGSMLISLGGRAQASSVLIAGGATVADPGSQLQAQDLLVDDQQFGRLSIWSDARVDVSGTATIEFLASISMGGSATPQLSANVIVNNGLMDMTAEIGPDVFGDVENNNLIQTADNVDTWFHDDFQHNGVAVETGAGGRTRILGNASGIGPYTGPGEVEFVANVRPGGGDGIGVAGIINIDGMLDLGANANLNIELGGTVIDQNDRIFVDGDASIDGDITVSLINGFMPSDGDAFPIVVIGGTRTGLFNFLGEGDTVATFGTVNLNITYSLFGGNDIGLIAMDAALILGDVNGDGLVNLLDVEPFVDLISSGGFNAAADINMDGVVNLLDVGPFIELLSGN